MPRVDWTLIVIILVALTVRLAYEIETREVPTVRHLIGDASGYYDWAQGIAAGDWLGEESFYQAPLYPYVLGVWLKLVGPGVGGIRLMQAVWGAVAVGCLAYGTGRMFGRRAGIVAGAMLALYAPAVFFDGIVQKASLACILICALVAAMSRLEGRRHAWRAMLVGVLCGLLVLTRENALIWLVVLAVWAWWPGEGTVRWRMLGTYAIGVALVLGPVGMRNRVVGGEWSLSTFQAGPNFYIGNHRGADGRYQPLVRGHESPAFERKDATELARRESGRELSPREVSRYWMNRAIDDIEADPVWWLGLMGRKLLLVWNRYEVSDVESLYVHRKDSIVLGVSSFIWHFGVLCPLAVVGVISTWDQRRRLWVYYALIVSMALAVAMFYVMARYRFPLVPLMIPFAAAGCVSLWEHLRAGRHRSVVTCGLIAAAVAVVVNWPMHDEKRLNAMAWMNVGVALARDGDLNGATDCFHRAVEGHPQSAEANNNLAQALALAGDYAGAVAHYRAALASDPDLMGVAFNLAVALEQLGQLDEAIDFYGQAVNLDPSDEDARRAIERLSGQ